MLIRLLISDTITSITAEIPPKKYRTATTLRANGSLGLMFVFSAFLEAYILANSVNEPRAAFAQVLPRAVQ
jgi:cellobiose-specific phosphotransferase system component IIC